MEIIKCLVPAQSPFLLIICDALFPLPYYKLPASPQIIRKDRSSPKFIYHIVCHYSLNLKQCLVKTPMYMEIINVWREPNLPISIN